MSVTLHLGDCLDVMAAMDAEYLEIARLRIAKAQEQPPLWNGAK